MAKDNKKNKDKKNDKDDEDDKKYKVKELKKIFSTVIHFLKLIVILIIFMYVSATLVFLVKELPRDALNDLFPTKCDCPPFGTKDKNPCMKYGLEDVCNQDTGFFGFIKDMFKSIITLGPFKKSYNKGKAEGEAMREKSDKLEASEAKTDASKDASASPPTDAAEAPADASKDASEAPAKAQSGGDNDCNSHFTDCEVTDCLKCSENPEDCKDAPFTCNKVEAPKIPWPFVSKSLSKSIFSILSRYKNFILSSMADTEIGLNWHTKSVICKLRSQPYIPCSFLIVVSLLIFKFLFYVAALYYPIRLIIAQCSKTFDYGWWGLLIIWGGFMLTWMLAFVSYITCLGAWLLKILLGSLGQKENRQAIHAIVYNNKALIGYLLGAIFISTLYKIDMDESYGNPVRLIVLVTYLIILFTHVIIHIPGVIFKSIVGLVSCLF